MIIRQKVFDTYWKFAALRQEVFFKRIKNLPPPWTTDEILNTYKFCNAYRASDRGSQFLIKDVIYRGSPHEEEVIFRILLFRMFNKIETWQYLENRLGRVTVAGFDFDVYSNLLQEAMACGRSIYTSAYMSCANKAFGYERKHQNHLALIGQMIHKDRIAQKIVGVKSLHDVFRALVAYPLIGSFMGYQLAVDINYSEVVDCSENSFTVAGPGAVRGIQKCFADTGDKSNEYIIQWMAERQDREFERLGIKFKSLWGRPLHYIDCQGLFCETDKYCRVAFPELKSNRKVIKARFHPDPGWIDYFYPPKWHINDKVRHDLAQRNEETSRTHSVAVQLPRG